MNTTTPVGFQNAAFFVVGKMFCLRGGREHRGLQLSQLKRFHDKYVYYENVSKNRNGSFKHLRVKSKVVLLYPSPEAGQRALSISLTHTSAGYHLKLRRRIFSK